MERACDDVGAAKRRYGRPRLMARMSIDDSIGRDTRVKHLAELAGWSVHHTVGVLVLEVWPLCYDRVTAILPPGDVDRAVSRSGFAALLVQSRLASPAGADVLITGAAKRVTYLVKCRENGGKGGKEKARKQAELVAVLKAGHSQAIATLYHPIVPDPVPPPVLVPETPKPKKSDRSVRPKPGDSTPAEVDLCMSILKRLGEHTETAYSGAKEHLRLITNQLRLGRTEMDLRKVIGYCALPSGKNWKENPKMREYLRPETLFGPESIERYLDAARSWYAKEYPEDRPQEMVR